MYCKKTKLFLHDGFFKRMELLLFTDSLLTLNTETLVSCRLNISRATAEHDSSHFLKTSLLGWRLMLDVLYF